MIVSGEVSYKTNLKDANLQFDQDENYQSGASFNRITIKDKAYPTWNCTEKMDNCIDRLSYVTSTVLNIKNNEGVFNAPYFEVSQPGGITKKLLPDCNVMNGIYELYPNTFVPKKLVLRNDCTLSVKVEGVSTTTLFPSGSILTLDADGYVLQKN